MGTVGNLRRLLVGVAIALPTALGVLAVGGLVASQSATAASVTPIFLQDTSNTSCTELGQPPYTTPARTWSDLKFEGGNLPSQGNSQTLTSSDSYLTVTITRTGLDEWSWTANKGVDAVLVKDGVAGSNFYLYDVDPNGGGDEAMSDSGLVVPGDQTGSRTSHLSFCYDVEASPPASLTVIKHVINDDGGTASADDWTMNVAGPTPLSFPGGEAPGTTNSVSEGTYTITESGGPPGYTLTYSGWCDSSGTSHLPAGQSYTCTLTNDDNEQPPNPATLIVKKVVVDDDGGTASPDDFSFSVNGGAAQPFQADGQNNLSVPAGTYNVTEPAVAGYTTTYDNCSDIELAPGGTATCTVTNNDVRATLIVKKVVVNDNGGTKVASDFSFQVNGGQAQPFEADGQNNLSVNPGTYNVKEPAVGGYTTSYDGCSNIQLPPGGTATCTVTNNDVASGLGSLSVSKSANPTSLKEPGGQVAYSVTITNTSLDVAITVTNVVDDKFGDLDDEGGSGCFDVPINMAPGAHASCQFTKQITGVGGTSHVNTVTVGGHDEFGHPLSASDSAQVDITPKRIDLVVIKDATSPTPLNGTVTYTMTVTNKGPDTATNVQLADPAPAGITYLSANPTQGTCSVGPALIACDLGTLAAGQTVTITATGRATIVGQLTNTATVTGSGGAETNPADNVDSATTVVAAPLRPPTTTPTPKPKPKPEVCLALTVSPKMIKADGKPDKVVAKVTAAGKRVKGAKVFVRGAGVRKTGRTNGTGVAVLRINPQKPGLITITTLEEKHACGAKRIGVVGVFLPPVTG